MYIEEALQKFLEDTTSKKVYPISAPEGIKSPYIVYQKVRGKIYNALQQDLSEENATYMITVFSNRLQEAIEIDRQLKGILRNYKGSMNGVIIGSVNIDSEVYDFDYQKKLYEVNRDYTIIFKEV